MGKAIFLGTKLHVDVAVDEGLVQRSLGAFIDGQSGGVHFIARFKTFAPGQQHIDYHGDGAMARELVGLRLRPDDALRFVEEVHRKLLAVRERKAERKKGA